MKIEDFKEGDKVVWLYWPPDAKHHYWQRVDGVVLRTIDRPTYKRAVIKVWDSSGNEYVRRVDPERLMKIEAFLANATDKFPSHLHGDGAYPVPKRREVV